MAISVKIVGTQKMEIVNFDDHWKCQHKREDEKDVWSGILLVLLNGYLISKYISKYKKSQERLQEIAKRQQAMSLEIKDHYLSVIHPQKMFAISKALSMPIPSTSISCGNHDLSALGTKAEAQRDKLIKMTTLCDQFGCDNSIALAAKMAEADTSFSRSQFLRRRKERRTELKRRIVQKAHAATFDQPQGIAQLMNGAAEIYSTIFKNAQVDLAGAVAGFGYGLKQLT